jgi:hypothetical protein
VICTTDNVARDSGKTHRVFAPSRRSEPVSTLTRAIRISTSDGDRVPRHLAITGMIGGWHTRVLVAEDARVLVEVLGEGLCANGIAIDSALDW